MSIKIIATDLDGTLMAEDHVTVSEYTKKTLYAAHKAGVKIGLATGRTFSLTKYVIDQVPFCDFIICSNGATAIELKTEKPIYENLIPFDVSKKIIEIIDKYDVFYQVYVDGRSIVDENKGDYYCNSLIPQDFIDQVMKSMIVVNDVIKEVNGRAVENINIFPDKIEDKIAIEKEISKIDCVSFTSAIANDIEIGLKAANKGDALKGVCKEYGFTGDEVMAFGDAGNDIPMLEFAKYSFAMDNGTIDCKSSAKYIADSNKNNGLAKAVEQFVLKG